MDILYKPESSISKLMVMLLVNLTRLEAGTSSLLQVCFALLCFGHQFLPNLLPFEKGIQSYVLHYLGRLITYLGKCLWFQIGDEKMQGFYVMKLVRSFCRSSNETGGAVLLLNLNLLYHSCFLFFGFTITFIGIFLLYITLMMTCNIYRHETLIRRPI